MANLSNFPHSIIIEKDCCFCHTSISFSAKLPPQHYCPACHEFDIKSPAKFIKRYSKNQVDFQGVCQKCNISYKCFAFIPTEYYCPKCGKMESAQQKELWKFSLAFLISASLIFWFFGLLLLSLFALKVEPSFPTFILGLLYSGLFGVSLLFFWFFLFRKINFNSPSCVTKRRQAIRFKPYDVVGKNLHLRNNKTFLFSVLVALLSLVSLAFFGATFLFTETSFLSQIAKFGGLYLSVALLAIATWFLNQFLPNKQ